MVAEVWEGHDYIPRVFDDWVSDPGAWFQAAEVDGELVGIQRLRPIARTVVWYEGLRVAPQKRRQGLARAMLNAAAGQARGLGFTDPASGAAGGSRGRNPPGWPRPPTPAGCSPSFAATRPWPPTAA
ncbi:MAG: GNAT family N-acetyltransferase [Chloroflexi bacterium]|nr:MAG: GNAT family N-acetyltransferase [Chloroflexota bacterium]